MVLDMGALDPNSDIEGDSSSVNVPPSGDSTAEGGAAGSAGASVGWALKKVDMNEYSAVALSTKTKSSDLTNASKGSF